MFEDILGNTSKAKQCQPEVAALRNICAFSFLPKRRITQANFCKELNDKYMLN